MDYRHFDKGATFRLEFLIDDEFVVPDNGTVTYTLYDNDGVAVGAQTAVAVTTWVEDIYASVAIASTYHVKAALVSESRTLEVSYEFQGKPYTFQINYTLIDRISTNVSPATVRSILGVSVYELPDADIDVYIAYLLTQEDAASLSTYLAAGGITTVRANQAIALMAALQAMPSLQLRVLSKKRTDFVEAQRLDKINLNSLQSTIAARYASMIELLTASLEVAPDLFSLSSSVDPITGA